MSQIDSVIGIKIPDKQRKPENILKAVIGGKVELRLVRKSFAHAEQRFIVRALDVRLDVARPDTAEQ